MFFPLLHSIFLLLVEGEGCWNRPSRPLALITKAGPGIAVLASPTHLMLIAVIQGQKFKRTMPEETRLFTVSCFCVWFITDIS